MKRFIVITLILLISVQLFYPKIVAHEGNEERQVIPDEAIRLRILANSNDERDQEIKRKSAMPSVNKLRNGFKS